MRGIFINFEGVDGSGKGTQISMLMDRLTTLGYPVISAKEPGGTELGREIRKLLFHHPTTLAMAPNVPDALLLADHVQNVETVIKPALAVGKLIVSDRYAFSQFAYSAAREFHPLLAEAYQQLLGPVPDLIFLLCGPVEQLLGRAQSRATENHQSGKAWNNLDSQQQIQEAYLRVLEPYPQTVVVHTDALSPEDLFEQRIWPEVERLLCDWTPRKPAASEAGLPIQLQRSA